MMFSEFRSNSNERLLELSNENLKKFTVLNNHKKNLIISPVFESYKKMMFDTTEYVPLIKSLGTDLNPDNDDEFVTANFFKTGLTSYDIGGIGRTGILQSSLKFINLGLFDDFIETDCTVDVEYFVAEGGAGLEVNKIGLEAATGGYGTFFEGGITPEIKIGKLGVKVRAYALGYGIGAFLKGGGNYTDASGRKHLLNIEGVFEYVYGVKANVDIYWGE